MEGQGRKEKTMALATHLSRGVVKVGWSANRILAALFFQFVYLQILNSFNSTLSLKNCIKNS